MKIRPGAQRVRNCLGIVVTVSAAVSCAPVPDQANTVTYYRAHATERGAQLKKCVDEPGSIGRTPDCVNAREAARLEANRVISSRAHAKGRGAQQKRGGEEPGSIGRTPDCVNAREAARLEGIGSKRTLPPLNLPSEAKPSTGS